MSTGDLNGNLQRLLRELRAIKCPADVDEVGLRLGDPVALLPLFNFTLLKFSRHVARFIVRHGFELAGKTDQRFVESCFKLFRDVLNVRTVLTPAQFFEHGYAERKVLLLCDVIAVCKKLHNEEVRQERLTALKATRQNQVGSRLVAPRKSSPQVKVVRNDDMEIQQVLAPQHLPNASDAAQSVYKPKRVIATSRSPSASPSLQPAPAKAASRPQSSPHSSDPSGQGRELELTFRPLASTSTGQVLRRQAPAGSAATHPPIHTWFMNPAFAAGEDANVDLGSGTGVSIGASGRPDSSAWWRVSSSSPEQPYWRSGGETAAAAGHPIASDSSAGGAADSGRHLFFGRQPAVAMATGGPPQGNLHHAVPTEPGPQTQQRQLERAAKQLPQQKATVVTQRKGGAAVAVVPPFTAGSICAAAAASGSGHTFAARDLDEWSFSKFFGPGKAKPQRRAGNSAGDDTDDSSQHGAGDSDDGGDANIQDPAKVGVAAEDNLDTDGNPSDQDHRLGATRSPASRRRAPRTASSSPAGDVSQTRQQQRHQAPGAASIAADRAGMEVDWSAQLVKLEQETQQQLQQLQSKLVSAEEELEKTRSEARHTREVLQARVTVLEGRVRFLECELELCVRRAPGQDLSRVDSPGHSPSPVAPGGIAAEPSLSWNSPGRQRSGASPAHRRLQEQPQPAPAPPSSGVVGAQHAAASAVAPPAVGPAPVYSHLQDPGVVKDTAQANPDEPPAASSMPGLAAGGKSHVKHWMSVAADGAAETRWDARNAVPAAAPLRGYPPAYSSHLLRDGTNGQATQSGAMAPASAQGLTQSHDPSHLPGIKPATSQPSSLRGGTGHRGPLAFSPMPRPTFSFQPSNLMQRVASAAVQPPSYHHHQQQEHSHLLQQHQSWGSTSEDGRLAGCLPPGPESHSYGVSTDGAQSSAQYTTGPVSAAGDVGQGGLHLNASSSSTASGHVSSSLDVGIRSLAVNEPEDRAAGTVPWNAVAAGSYGHQAAWRGLERAVVRGAGRESILGRQVANLDGSAAYGSQQQQQHQQDEAPLLGSKPAGFVSAALTSHQHNIPAQSQVVSTAVSTRAQALPHQAGLASSGSVNGAIGAVYTGGLVAPQISGGESSVGNTAGSGDPGMVGGGSLKTEDVINSLYLRYTEAQDFLQTLRKR
ncbi:hypothetical protein Vafri_2721 [Volvox africanus]|uniref:Centrosomal protein of 44 kDa n=1 Tax=Volvox africanus TaxID=51714 RepID=A0A8J4ETZ2_9CHLO|nr:hypothetical protein Vafri_2721 [Volvox africanus]